MSRLGEEEFFSRLMALRLGAKTNVYIRLNGPDKTTEDWPLGECTWSFYEERIEGVKRFLLTNTNELRSDPIDAAHNNMSAEEIIVDFAWEVRQCLNNGRVKRVFEYDTICIQPGKLRMDFEFNV